MPLALQHVLSSADLNPLIRAHLPQYGWPRYTLLETASAVLYKVTRRVKQIPTCPHVPSRDRWRRMGGWGDERRTRRTQGSIDKEDRHLSEIQRNQVLPEHERFYFSSSLQDY